jgi:hypothetical protein
MGKSRRCAASRIRSASNTEQRTRIAVLGPAPINDFLLTTCLTGLHGSIFPNKRSSISIILLMMCNTYALIVRRCFSASTRIRSASSLLQRIKSAVRSIDDLLFPRLTRESRLLREEFGLAFWKWTSVNVGDNFVL